MIYAFWWSGRGYLTVLILVGMLTLFAAVLRAGSDIFSDRLAFWGAAFCATAVPNWFGGLHLNRRKIAARRSNRWRDRFFYRARHRFMSLPMESFSLVLAAIGLAMILIDLI